MDALQVYGALSSKIKSVASGFKSAVLVGDTVIRVTFVDGSTLDITIPTLKGDKGDNGADGDDGISITAVEITDDYHLICTLSDGTTKDAGEIQKITAADKTDIANQVINSGSVQTKLTVNPTATSSDVKLQTIKIDGTQYRLAGGGADVYDDYSALLAASSIQSKTSYEVGYNIYLRAVGIPDLWVSAVLDSPVTTTVDDFTAGITGDTCTASAGYFSFSRLETQKVDLSGYYQKPSTGIPKTDLASVVQTSLDKADTALQAATHKSNLSAITVTKSDGTTATYYVHTTQA